MNQIETIESITGQIYRHGPGEDDQELICSATRMGGGFWLTVADRGIYGGKVYGEHQGLLVLVDLWIHPSDGGSPMPVQWASMTAMKPVAVLYVPGDVQTPKTVLGDTDTIHHRDYARLFTKDGDAEGEPMYDRPWPQRYDVERESALALVGRFCLGYGVQKTIFGGPVLDAKAGLQGIIVGRDWGVDSSHAGFFSPIQFIAPALEIVESMVRRLNDRESTWRLGLDFVSHRSHDVYFD